MRSVIWLLAAGCGRIGFSGAAGNGAERDAAVADAVDDPDLVIHIGLGTVPPIDHRGLLAPGMCTAGRCPTVVPGRVGNALRFDGADDYVQFASVPTLDFGATAQPFSVALWYRAAALQSSRAIATTRMTPTLLATLRRIASRWRGSTIVTMR